MDLMLTGGIDIKSSPRLQDEFDRIVDQVNALEMEALKQGNGLRRTWNHPRRRRQRYYVCVDPNWSPRPSPSRDDEVRSSLMVNDYVAAYINFFANTQKGHNTLLHSFERTATTRR